MEESILQCKLAKLMQILMENGVGRCERKLIRKLYTNQSAKY